MKAPLPAAALAAQTFAVRAFAVLAFAVLGGPGSGFAAPPPKDHHRSSARVAPVSAVPPLAYSYRELANGLKVYAVRDVNTPNVAVQVWYRVGSKNDPKGRSGFAHLFEHLMFKATRNLPSESFDRLTEDVGGTNNASTNDDYTEYHEVIPANYLKPILWAEAERMGSLVVDQAAFASERSVVEEELRQRVLAQPYGELFYHLLSEISFDTSPYGRPTIGSIPDLDAATLADVQAFHAAWYRPDNAVLVVVGNFDPKDLDLWVDAYFGKLARPSWPIPAAPPAEPARAAPKLWKAYAPNTPLPAVMFSYPAPPADSPDLPALEVADAVLSRGDSSRLHQSLVYRQRIAQDAFTFLELRNQPGAYGAGVILSQGVDPARGEAGLKAEIAGMASTPPTPEELARAKAQLITQSLRERETANGKASELAAAVVLFGDAAEVNRSVAEIQAVTAADVVRVARKYWSPAVADEIVYRSDADKPKDAADYGPAATIQATNLAPPADLKLVALAPIDQREKPPAPGAPVAFHPPAPLERTLANGLHVVIAPDHQLPLVSAELIVRAGAAYDPPSLPGVAAMTADLVTKGAGKLSAPDIARAIESLGGDLGSTAGYDASALTLTVERDRLAQAMPVFADIAQRPTFGAEELDRDRQQALNDLEVASSEPSALAGWAAGRAVFGAGPYGHPASGVAASLTAMKPADMAAFHRAWWRADHSTLVLAGDISPEQGWDLAQRWFGQPGSAEAPLAPVMPTAPLKPRVIVVDLPKSGQAAVLVARLGLARRDPRYYPALVADAVLGGGYSSRLNQEIRVKRGLSYGANSGFGFRREPGPFQASTQTKNASAAEVVDLIEATMRGMAAAPVGAAELQARKSALIGEFGRSVETTAGTAGVLGGLSVYGVPLDELGRYAEKVTAVTPDEVQQVSAEVLDPGPASVIVVGDAQVFLPALKARFPDVEVIPAQDFDPASPSLRKAASPGKAQ
jgi:zinc protease